MTGDDVDAAWFAFTQVVESMYGLAGVPVSNLSQRRWVTKMQRPSTALAPDGDSENTLLRFHLRRCRRLREVVRLWPTFPVQPSHTAACV